MVAQPNSILDGDFPVLDGLLDLRCSFCVNRLLPCCIVLLDTPAISANSSLVLVRRVHRVHTFPGGWLPLVHGSHSQRDLPMGDVAATDVLPASTRYPLSLRY